jgi:hypothetical protein
MCWSSRWIADSLFGAERRRATKGEIVQTADARIKARIDAYREEKQSGGWSPLFFQVTATEFKSGRSDAPRRFPPPKLVAALSRPIVIPESCYQSPTESEREVIPMPVMQPPTGPIEISDPNNVPELFINGPFNVINMGGMVQITFTTVRPNTNDLFSGNSAPGFGGTVACRLLMPAELAQQLVRTLADNLIKAADQSAGTAGPAQTQHRFSGNGER